MTFVSVHCITVADNVVRAILLTVTGVTFIAVTFIAVTFIAVTKTAAVIIAVI